MPGSPLVQNPGNRRLSAPRQPCHWSWAEGEATPSPTFCLSLPLKSGLQIVEEGGDGPSFREAISSTVPRVVSPALLGTSAISGKGQMSHSKLRERGRGELADSQGAGRRKPGGLIFSVSKGGVFPLLRPPRGLSTP